MSQLISRRPNSFELHVRSTPFSRAGALLLTVPRAMWRAAQRAWAAHSEQRLLQELSDYHLRDIGISREQIPHVIRKERDL